MAPKLLVLSLDNVLKTLARKELPMIVNQTSYVNHSYTTQSQKPIAASSQTTTSAGKSDQVSISDAGRQAQGKWQEIANKYDVHSITAKDMRSLSKDLYDGGFIGTGQMMAIGAPTSMNEDPNQKHDLLNDMRETFKISTAMGGHTEQSKQIYLDSIAVLERLVQSKNQ